MSIDLNPIPHIGSADDEQAPEHGPGIDEAPMNDLDDGEPEVTPDDPDIAGDDASTDPS